MKKLFPLVVGLFLVLSCANEETRESMDQISDSQNLVSVKEINTFIEHQLKQTGDVNWTQAPAHILYSAVMHGDEVLSVGYGEADEYFVTEQRSSQLDRVLQNIYDIVQRTEGVQKSNTDIDADDVLNYTIIRISKLQTIVALQKADQIRYLEPIGYGSYLQEKVQQKSAGCDKTGQTINSNDYRVIVPDTQLPWNFDIHNIPQAWEHSTGAGITIGLIDTGVSANQQLLGTNFNDGFSSGRSIQRKGTYIDSVWWWSTNVDGPDDKCGHGTQMASIIASPRNNDLMPVGVAYNCNLIAYRGTSDVVLEDYHERKGVSKALKELGGNNNVKIISMSVGYPWSIGNIKDAIKYAHSKGKMIIAAGGTSTTFTNWYGVIFPANMNETVAVTGLKDNGYNRCDICHDGSTIDFTIVMQRANDTSRNIPVLGFYSGEQAYVGGSSAATAVTAGIAALVWSRNPSMSRTQVLDKLKKAGEFYPTKNNKFGYGNINALKAVQ